MKFSVLIFTLFFVVRPFGVNYEKPDDDQEKIKEQALVVSPNPANKFLDIQIKNEMLGKTLSDNLAEAKYEVVILNRSGIMVFSTTKNVNHFSIFTGGLPEGDYNLICRVDTIKLKKNFLVKH